MVERLSYTQLAGVRFPLGAKVFYAASGMLSKERRWRQHAKNPSVWYAHAKMNAYVADLLYKEYTSAWQHHTELVEGTEEYDSTEYNRTRRNEDLHRYILMFYGFALENYLKR